MATLLTCTRINGLGSIDSAEVVINEQNKATVQNTSVPEFEITLRIFFIVAVRNQKQVLLSVFQTQEGERMYRYGESEKTIGHEAFVRRSISALEAEGIHAEVIGSENE